MINYHNLKENGLKYLLNMREGNSWKFRFSANNPATLIASGVAGMFSGFLGYIRTLPVNERREWAEYIKSFQNDDGWFEDADINDEHRLGWYGRDRALFHRTRHAICALYAFGDRPKRRLKMTEKWLGTGNMKKWLGTLNLADYWYASNMMMDAFLLLAHEYLYNQNRGAFSAIQELLDFCDENTNPKTGYHDNGLSETRNAMAGAMHLYPAYFLCTRRPKYLEAVVETTLALQQEDGLFGYETGTGGEDCLDYDAVLILTNFYFLVPGYQEKIEQSLEKCQQAIMTCLNPDGGFSPHRRNETYNFGTNLTLVEPRKSSLWATYSRLLTIAMAGKILDPSDKTFILGNNLMEIWDGGTGKMEIHPRIVKEPTNGYRGA